MNDSTKRELMIVVERAVRPVRASINRKRRMREELLGHLSAVFENEMELQSDVATGLERAKRRFGEPGKLTVELQQSVSSWDRARSVCDIMRLEPGDSLIHFFAKLVVLVMGTWAVLMLIANLGIMAGWKMEDIAVVVAGVLATIMFFGIFPFIIVSAASRIGPALCGVERQRSKWMALRWMLAAGFVFAPLFMYAGLGLTIVFRRGISQLLLTCFLSLAFTMLLLAKSRHATGALWASLEIGD